MLAKLAELLGVSGVIVGVYYLIYKQILSLNIFPTLTRKQAFRLILVMSVLTWLLAVLWLFDGLGLNVIVGDNNVIDSR